MTENIFADVDDVLEADTAAVPAIVSKPARFELTALEHSLAVALDVDLTGDARHLVDIATRATNQALTLVIESGLMLIAARQQLIVSERSETINEGAGRPKNEAFHAILDEFGLPYQRAYEAMSMAKYVAALPAEQHEDMLSLPKTKVMLLAAADPEVIADLFEDEDADIQALTVRELKNKIREQKAATTQANVQVQKAEATAKHLEKQLAEATKSRADIGDIVPPHVSDVRLEVAALYKKAELSIDGIAHQISEGQFLEGEWAVSVARSNFAALQSIIAQAKGVAAQLHKAYGADLDGDHSTMERLTQKELFKCATEYKQIIGEHEHEAALREYARDMDKPKGKGRPKAAPVKE